jgi:hypothetical protein
LKAKYASMFAGGGGVPVACGTTVDIWEADVSVTGVEVRAPVAWQPRISKEIRINTGMRREKVDMLFPLDDQIFYRIPAFPQAVIPNWVR